MFLEITVAVLSLALVILAFLLFRQKQQKPEIKEKVQPDSSSEAKFQEQEISSLISQLDNSHQEIQKLKELVLTNFADHKSSLRERFDYLDKSFAELNKIFASSKRGMLGNSYLNELLGIILPRDDSVYQLEFTLKKKTEKGEGLRVDAMVFGAEKKNKGKFKPISIRRQHNQRFGSATRQRGTRSRRNKFWLTSLEILWSRTSYW